MVALVLAVRNIWRNTRRSLLAASSVALAVALMVFFQAMIDGWLESIVKNTTRNETGHIQIITKDFERKEEFLPVDKNIKDPEELIKKINSDEELTSQVHLITQRIRFGVLLANEGKNVRAMGVAGKAEKEKELLMLHSSLVEGRYLKDKRDIIIGQGLAEKLHYSLGDEVKVVTQGSMSALRLRKFTVAGIFKTGVRQMDDSLFQISLEDGKALLRMEEEVQQMVIMLEDYRLAGEVASRIRTILGENSLVVRPWSAVGGIANMINLVRVIFNVMNVAIGLLGAIIITNVMMMVVLERKKEIGIMKSLGFTQGRILSIFLLEGIGLGILGSLAGLVLGTLINIPFMTIGMDFSAYAAELNFPMDRIIKSKMNPAMMAVIFAMGTAVSGIVSYLPSRRAAKMNAVDAIRSA